jgi:hypothetical protein
MNKLVLAAIALTATPAMAQTAPAADHAMHADHAAAAAKFSLDTPISVIAADARGKAALDADLPGLTTHEHFEMFKDMTLNQLAPMAGDKMPAEALAKLAADLAAIH